jgi:hypothetical protein
MLEIFGKGYVIQHCISLFQEEQETESYRIFVTELLTGMARGLGNQVNMRYVDVLYPKKQKSANEIIDHIREGLK